MANEKSPTQILKEEHQIVLKKLDALEEVISRLDKKGEVSSRLRELASFFESDFWVHFVKEEEALFPEIEKFIPREGGPTGMMMVEHEELRNTNKEFQRAINNYLKSADGSEAREMIRQHGTHFVGVLREHINKEDNILFMMAEMHLDPAQAGKVVRLFDEIGSAEGQGG